jgi:peptidoglycan/LPS O-acetylase OafA/YrhL
VSNSNRPTGHIHRNHQFDFLRILFATLVILAHAPELTDGNNSREIFSRLTHSHVSFGALGVDGFFLLSGFLIVNSWQQNPELLNFLRKRLLRIIPGYLVAALLSTLVVGLLAPGIDHFFRHLDIHFIKSIFAVDSPSTPSVLPGQPYPDVNGSMWTIQYELRCYIIVALLGLCGFFRRPALWLATTIVFLIAMVSPLKIYCHWPLSLYPIIGDPTQVFRLTAVYFVGGCFFLYRDRIPFRPLFVYVSILALLCVRFFDPTYMELALVLFGSYLMFYFGRLSTKCLAWMKNVPDISYGVYLYGWPVISLWIWYRHGSPWIAFLASTVICFGLGWMSWHFIERPALTLKRRSAVPLPPSVGGPSGRRTPAAAAPPEFAAVGRSGCGSAQNASIDVHNSLSDMAGDALAATTARAATTDQQNESVPSPALSPQSGTKA